MYKVVYHFPEIIMEDQEDQWTDYEDDFTDEEPEVRTVHVQGITPEIKDDILKLYFENTKRSGGGDIESINVDRANGSATIIYRESSGK